ncbi:MAG: hypothetical protein KF809_14940 [Chloroflexi bacterium]|nr:hypothetical protein [Chloroflexota bacterium]
MAYHGPNPGSSRRRVTRQQLDASRAAWDAGDFSAEWKPWRHMAAMTAGIIDPPAGDPYDSWADDSPSPRAILIRAIRETPKALEQAICQARRPTWEAVIEGLLRTRDRLGEAADEREREWQAVRRGEMTHAGSIARVILDSLSRADAA